MTKDDQILFEDIKRWMLYTMKTAGIFTQNSSTYPFSWKSSGVLAEPMRISNQGRSSNNRIYTPIRGYVAEVGRQDIELFKSDPDLLSAFVGAVLQNSILSVFSTRKEVTDIGDIVFTLTRLLEWFVWRVKEMPVACDILTTVVSHEKEIIVLKIYSKMLCISKTFSLSHDGKCVQSIIEISLFVHVPRIKEGKEISNEENAHKPRFKPRRICC